MHMVMFVLDDIQHLDQVLDAWDALGVSGVTIIESTGINRRKSARLAGNAFMAGINRLVHTQEEGHLTLITIVKGAEAVRDCIKAAEEIVGNLKLPHTGVMAAWKLSIVKGVPNPSLDTEEE